MDKETFVKYVNDIKDLIDKEKAINNALASLSPDFGGFAMGDAISHIIDLLALIVHDGYEWLNYYIWETDCGTNDCADSITETDGTKIPFKTPEDVYDLIVSEYDEDKHSKEYYKSELNKYKRLYENERDHTKTLEQIKTILIGGNQANFVDNLLHFFGENDD